MTRQELIALCLTFPGSAEDYPFQEKHCIVRHVQNKKWFALVIELEGRLCINLKCEPMQADFWRGVYQDCIPGWHMNKTHWNTIRLNGDVPIDELKTMIAHSYSLTLPKVRGKSDNESRR